MTGTSARISALRSLLADSSTKRRIESDSDLVSRIVPWPVQRGQTFALVSPSEGRSRWRDISKRPKRDILPTCTRARSMLSASRILFSTALWFFAADISIKSITISPPISRNRNWRAISSAASKFVCNAVSSIFPPLVARAELISMETKASVGSMTIDPPDGKSTSR